MNEAKINELNDAFKNGTLTLYLGSGVSRANGLPDWNGLVASMYFNFMQTEEWRRLQPFPNYVRAVTDWYLSKSKEPIEIIIRKLRTGWSVGEYNATLRECLYTSFSAYDNSGKVNDLEMIDQNRTLQGIISLFKESVPGRKGLKSVITYNYDDLLERALTAQGITNFQTICRQGERVERGKIPIFHVHGYIPIPKRGVHDTSPFDTKIILSEEDYNSIAHDVNFWGNNVQMSCLTNNSGLMVGLSIADRNLRRLLDAMKSQPMQNSVYAFMQEPELTEPEPAEVAAIHNEAVKWVGIIPDSQVKDSLGAQLNIPKIAAQILNWDRHNHDRMYSGLGIEPVWYKNHDEILTNLKLVCGN